MTHREWEVLEIGQAYRTPNGKGIMLKLTTNGGEKVISVRKSGGEKYINVAIYKWPAECKNGDGIGVMPSRLNNPKLPRYMEMVKLVPIE